MADKKISALTAATTPLDGTEVLPIVQSGATVKVQNNDLRPKQIQSNATSGVLQITGPAASTTRVMTTPNANFTVARTDAGQTFTGTQTVLAAATQDAVALAGRAGGSGSYVATISPTTLSASRTVTLPNADTTVPVATQVLTFSGPTAARTITLPDANFTAARTDAAQSFTGDQTLSTGNLVVGTSGKGVDFSATPGTGTSELFNDYETGTWTPVLSSDGTEPTSVTGTFVGSYVKVGRMVTAWGVASFTTYSNGTGVGRLGGLPFTCNTSVAGRGALGVEQCTFATGYTTVNVTPANGTAYVYPRQCGSAKDDAGVTLTTFAPSSATTKYWIFTVQYETNS